MGKVILDVSVSLDGFMAAANRTRDEPLGAGGERLHDWAMGGDERGRALLDDAVGGLGASIAGRRTYDDSLRWWGADGPTGAQRRPLFVVTHEAPPATVPGGVYTFVRDGIESALAQAQAVAGERAVSLMGASLGQQFLAAGLVDEIQLHVVPVLFGDGLRVFGALEGHVELEAVEAVQTPLATHVRYRVRR